jgi:hypothetical protein
MLRYGQPSLVRTIGASGFGVFRCGTRTVEHTSQPTPFSRHVRNRGFIDRQLVVIVVKVDDAAARIGRAPERQKL